MARLLRTRKGIRKLARAGGSGLIVPRVDDDGFVIRGVAMTGTSRLITDLLQVAIGAEIATATFCCWIRPTALGTPTFFINPNTLGNSPRYWVDNFFGVVDHIGQDGGQVPITTFESAANTLPLDTATHIALSFNTNTQTQQLYINGAPSLISSVNIAGLVAIRPSMVLFADWIGTNGIQGAIGEFWWDDSFVDLDGGGISKFYNGMNYVDLGPRGQLPTGSIPQVYFGGTMTANTGGELANSLGGLPGWNGGANLGTLNGWALNGDPLTDFVPI